YTYASLYSVSGKLVGLRGDIAPMELLAGGDFELLRRRPVPTAARYSSACAEERIGGYRYDFKARADTVIAGLTVSRGEMLALSTMTPEGLRACAAAARIRAGERLLGICVFRLPASDDKANLTVDQIAAALANRDLEPLDFEIRTDRDSTGRQLSMSI